MNDKKHKWMAVLIMQMDENDFVLQTKTLEDGKITVYNDPYEITGTINDVNRHLIELEKTSEKTEIYWG